MRTKLGGMIYHEKSRRLIYESLGFESKGVYEINFSSVPKTGAWSMNKFYYISFKKIDQIPSLNSN